MYCVYIYHCIFYVIYTYNIYIYYIRYIIYILYILYYIYIYQWYPQQINSICAMVETWWKMIIHPIKSRHWWCSFPKNWVNNWVYHIYIYCNLKYPLVMIYIYICMFNLKVPLACPWQPCPAAAGNSLIVRSTICCSVALGPNSSEAFLATSLRPTSKASRALDTWGCGGEKTLIIWMVVWKRWTWMKMGS